MKGEQHLLLTVQSLMISHFCLSGNLTALILQQRGHFPLDHTFFSQIGPIPTISVNMKTQNLFQTTETRRTVSNAPPFEPRLCVLLCERLRFQLFLHNLQPPFLAFSDPKNTNQHPTNVKNSLKLRSVTKRESSEQEILTNFE